MVVHISYSWCLWPSHWKFMTWWLHIMILETIMKCASFQWYLYDIRHNAVDKSAWEKSLNTTCVLLVAIYHLILIDPFFAINQHFIIFALIPTCLLLLIDTSDKTPRGYSITPRWYSILSPMWLKISMTSNRIWMTNHVSSVWRNSSNFLPLASLEIKAGHGYFDKVTDVKGGPLDGESLCVLAWFLLYIYLFYLFISFIYSFVFGRGGGGAACCWLCWRSTTLIYIQWQRPSRLFLQRILWVTTKPEE